MTERDLQGGPPSELVAFMENFELPAGEPLAGYLRKFDGHINAGMRVTRGQELVLIGERDGWRLTTMVWKPQREGPFPTLLLIHGGAWVTGNHLSHRRFASELAAAGFLTVSVDYRLAPKYRFPAGFEDCADALGWLAGSAAQLGGDPNRIAVVGDSAGANLAAALVIREDRPVIRAAALLYGIYDFHAALPVVGRLIGGQGPSSQTYIAASEFDSLRGDHRLSPLHGLDGRVPLYIGVGTRDPLLLESRRLHEHLIEQSAHHVYDEFPNTPHCYLQMPGHPSYRTGLDALTSFLSASLEVSASSHA